MTHLEFQNALEMGFGRAIQHLKTHNPEQYIDEILAVCFDGWSKDSPYLVDVFELTDTPAKFLSFIQHLLLKDVEQPDTRRDWQLMEVLLEIAKRGSKKARQTLYEVFEKRLTAYQRFTTWDAYPDRQIRKLDGIAGLKFILEKFGEVLIRDSTCVIPANIIRFAAEDLGEDLVNLSIAQWKRESVAIAAFIKAEKSRPKNRIPKSIQHLPYKQIASRIKRSKKVSEYQLGLWGKQASKKEFLLAAKDLLRIRSPKCLRLYLRIFTNRAFPLAHQHLLKLANHPKEEVAAIALLALGQIKHPEVRDFALQYEPKPNECWDNAIGLLERNYQLGDALFIEQVLKKAVSGSNLHDSIFTALRIFERNPHPEALPSLLFIYEHTYCEFCRKDDIQLLEQIGVLPDSILEECVFDASLEIRAWAKEILEQRKSIT